MSLPFTRRSGIVTHLLVGVAALAAGAAGACAAGSGSGGASGEPDPVTTHAEWVSIRRGSDSIRAYVAYPERSTKAPAVIVIHEVFGLTSWEPTVADRLAKAGYVAIVPDLLSSKFGITPANADSGRKLVAQLEPERVTQDLDAVFGYVNALPAVAPGQIGTIGFCWGGGQSFRYATNNPKLRATVVCYGPAPDTASLARIQSPVLGVYGEDDARINAALLDVERQMKGMGKSFESRIYPGTGHGFLKPGRKGNDGAEVEKAWSEIVGFYRSELGR